jgi:hypothetical protein
MMKPKPKMPKKPIKLTLTKPLEIELLLDLNRFSSGSMLMKFADTMVTVTEGDKQIGSIGAAVGGCIFVQIDDRLWSVKRPSLWAAVKEADERYRKERV